MPRPREFDTEEVLVKAMNLFWQKGYLGTSLQDLVEYTGINRSSLYATFGDKHSLFMEAISHFRKKVVPTRMSILERPGASLEEIRKYFESVVDDLIGPARGRACLIANSAVELAAEDAEVAKQVNGHLTLLEKAFTHSLNGAFEKGQISSDASIRAYAKFLVNASQGLIVLGKGNPNRKSLTEIVEITMKALQ